MLWLFKHIYLHLILCSILVLSIEQKCSMYGVCNDMIPGKTQYCNVSKPPVTLTDHSTLDMLESICPEYVNDGKATTCCDPKQITVLKDSFQAVEIIIGKCPACYRNFLRLFCAMTCDPYQASFVTPTELDTEKAVSSLNYKLTPHFADTFYRSIKDVSYMGGKALAVLCNSNKCSEDMLFKALGDGSARAPFNIKFIATNESFAMNHTVFRCNETVPAEGEGKVGGPPCACADCSDSCFVPPVPPKPPKILILGIDVYYFAFGLIYIIFLISFVGFNIGCAYSEYLKRKREPEQLIPASPCQSASSEYSKEEIEAIKKRIGFQSRLSSIIENALSNCFGYLAFGVASWPITTIVVAFLVVLVLCSGLARFEITTDPIKLWSDSMSQAHQEKNFFDTNFAPFYRTEQIIISPRNHSNVSLPFYPSSENSTFGPVWDLNFLNRTIRLQNKIKNMVVYSSDLRRNITLQDICFQPMLPENKNCAITSPLEYFQGNETLLNSVDLDEFDSPIAWYVNRLDKCGSSPTAVDKVPLGGTCLSSAGIPMPSNLVFGSYLGDHFNASLAIVMTFLVNDSVSSNSLLVKMAKEWELAFLDEVRQWIADNPDVNVSYQAQRSVEDELTRQSNADVFTVIISYLVMFLYVSLCLGSYRSFFTILVDIKLTLGLGGVLIVVLAIVTSVGIWSWAHVPASLIIIEVIPFLVLAVGVDNIFIMVQDFELDGDGHKGLVPKVFLPRFRNFFGERSPNRQLDVNNSPGQSMNYDEIEDDDEVSTIPIGEDASTFLRPHERARAEIVRRVCRTMARVGPSIFLSSLSETCAFFCGTISSMPAVKVFSMYAGLAIMINFLMQITVFVALLTLDARRTVDRRLDICCCVSIRHKREVLHIWPEDEPRTNGNGTSSQPIISPSSDSFMQPEPSMIQDEPKRKKRSRPWLYQFVSKLLSPAILNRFMRPIILCIMVFWTCFCLAVIPNGLVTGLDQKLSMPLDSYMLDYFEALSTVLKIGPPVYFVVTGGHNYTDFKGQNQICGVAGCDPRSLVNTIAYDSLIPDYSRLVSTPMSWFDDYLSWLASTGSSYHCCRLKKDNDSIFCPAEVPDSQCKPCPVQWITAQNSTSKRPHPDDFSRYLPFFLEENPGELCPKGGRAAYRVGVKLNQKDNISDLKAVNLPAPKSEVASSYFMTYHTTLKEPADFIDAVRQARKVADQLNMAWTKRNFYDTPRGIVDENMVFPYSVFYVFYEQYLNQEAEAALQLGICFIAISVITLIVLGLDLLATLIVFLGVAQILLSVLAVMVFWGITLNALSLVNLVVCVGIAVEFCIHIVRAYTVSLERTRVERAKSALASMGSSVLRGITLTKLGGIIVLAFSKSRLFQIFYFRMYLTMVISGATVGLLFIPVILSYIGPSVNAALLVRALESKDEDVSEKRKKMAGQRKVNSTLQDASDINSDEAEEGENVRV